MPASQIREQLDPSTWNRYLTVCLERSPYERFVSLYYHRHRTEPRITIDDFIRSGEWDLGRVRRDRRGAGVPPAVSPRPTGTIADDEPPHEPGVTGVSP